MIYDIARTPIDKGSVITWCGRQSSAMFLSLGVVRSILVEEGKFDKHKLFYTICTDRLGEEQQIRHEESGYYIVRTRYFRPVRLTNPSYVTVIVGLTEEALKERFPFGERIEKAQQRGT